MVTINKIGEGHIKFVKRPSGLVNQFELATIVVDSTRRRIEDTKDDNDTWD